jgi:hypothetical protein
MSETEAELEARIRKRLPKMIDVPARYANSSSLLFMEGDDHVEAYERLDEAVAAMRLISPNLDAKIASLVTGPGSLTDIVHSIEALVDRLHHVDLGFLSTSLHELFADVRSKLTALDPAALAATLKSDFDALLAKLDPLQVLPQADLDELDGVRRGRLGLGDQERDRLAREHHLIAGERHAEAVAAGRLDREVGCGEHRDDPWHGKGRLGVDAHDPGVGMGREDQAGMEQAVDVAVRRVARGAPNLRRRVGARASDADRAGHALAPADRGARASEPTRVPISSRWPRRNSGPESRRRPGS